jgi:hypothetical protein
LSSPTDVFSSSVRNGEGMVDRFPPYTSRQSRTRPAGLGRLFCLLSVLGYGLAGLLDVSIIGGRAFAADFDGGTPTADAADTTHLATGLLVVGAVMAVAAIIQGGGYAGAGRRRAPAGGRRSSRVHHAATAFVLRLTRRLRTDPYRQMVPVSAALANLRTTGEAVKRVNML